MMDDLANQRPFVRFTSSETAEQWKTIHQAPAFWESGVEPGLWGSGAQWTVRTLGSTLGCTAPRSLCTTEANTCQCQRTREMLSMMDGTIKGRNVHSREDKSEVEVKVLRIETLPRRPST